MKLINDIVAILTSLSFIDYVLYFSVLALLILIIALVYTLKNEDTDKLSVGSDEMEKEPEIDLEQIAKTIVENPEPLIDMTSYEEEQEQKAIISYDELIKESNKKHLQYDKLELVDNVITAKKINLTDMINEKVEEISEDTTIFHYEREEAFLETLRELNRLLN